MDAKTQKEHAAAVQGMLAMPGWQIIKEQVEYDENKLIELLVEEDDPTKFMAAQAELRAIRAFYKKIEGWQDIAI